MHNQTINFGYKITKFKKVEEYRSPDTEQQLTRTRKKRYYYYNSDSN